MKWMPLMRTGLAVRMDLLNEQWAQKNHGQSLERLAERGGLSVEEALAIAERRQWSAQRQEFESFRALALLVPTAESMDRPLADGPTGAQRRDAEA